MSSDSVPRRLATGHSRPSVNTPEKTLLVAILAQALRDLVYPGGFNPTRGSALDARNWFSSQETSPGSFLWICNALEIDPCLLRRWAGELHPDGDWKKQVRKVVASVRDAGLSEVDDEKVL